MAEDTAYRIGNPLLSKFPSSGDPANSRARSIWDMHYFNNRIYIGHGDFWANSGKTDVWIYNDTCFVKEYTVDDEMIFDFFEFDKKLFIPGNDPTEDWRFGNLYICDPNQVAKPRWIKHRTIPGGVHSFDVALFKGKLYASIFTDGNTPDRALVSTDMGRTWTIFIYEYCSFLVFDDFMFIAGDKNYRYDGTTLQNISMNIIVNSLKMSRKSRFRNGLLYANPNRYSLENEPLIFLPMSEIKNNGAATNIAKFDTENVRDIVIRDSSCYVMTAEEISKDMAYKGRIYSSTDLINWPLVTEFTVPGIPLSFEIMNNMFYIGLGCRYQPSLGWTCVGPESGSIWKIAAKSMGVLGIHDFLPTENKLHLNYPNPFKPTIQIPFYVPQDSLVTISIYNINNRLIDHLYNQKVHIFNHTATWDSSKYPTDIYYIRLKTEYFQYIRKFILLK